MKKLRRMKEDYFKLESAPSETHLSDDSDNERDSDYESELASVVDDNFEPLDDNGSYSGDSHFEFHTVTVEESTSDSIEKQSDPSSQHSESK